MALLDRVSRLIRANLNDLVEKAENPEKLLKQLLLDMENQRMQVKTQVAIAIADWHVLEKKKAENAASQDDWMRKAEMALARGDEALARVALERSIPFESAVRNLTQQVEDQSRQVEVLKTALRQLESKLTESRSHAEILLARYRRARTAQRAATAGQPPGRDDVSCPRASLRSRQRAGRYPEAFETRRPTYRSSSERGILAVSVARRKVEWRRRAATFGEFPKLRSG